jgi:hypothetical protein
MWSLTSDHTHCFLKFGIIKPAKVYNWFGYIQLRLAQATREPHIPTMEYAVTVAHMVTRTQLGYFSY